MIRLSFYEHGVEVITVLCQYGFEEAMAFADILLESSNDENAYCILG